MKTDRLPRSLAERADLAPRVRTLLEEQLAECGARVEPMLRAGLTEFEQQLFKLAEQSRNNAEQQTAFESLREVKRNRADAAPQLLLSLERRLAALGMRSVDAPRARFDLALVDHDEFDEAVALDDIATRTELRVSPILFELGHRYGVLIASPLLEAEALPLGPHALAHGFRDIALQMGLPREHRVLFYRMCDRRVMGAAESIYGGLNENLAEHGILPNLRASLPRRSQTSKARKQQPESTGPDAKPKPRAKPARPPAADSPAAAAAALGSLRKLLDQRRATLPPAPEEPAGGYTASAEDLQAVLGTLQGRASDPIQMGGREVQRTVQLLRQDMLSELRRFAPDGRPPQLAAEHRDVLELVSLLFDRLLDETRSGGPTQQLLGRLQVPLLRVALADRSFFSRRSHPARRLLNTVAETADLWVDGGDGEVDGALAEKLQRSVDRVLEEFTGDQSLFERLVDDLDSHVGGLRRRAEIAERRQVEAAQGRDRLEQARAQASAAISERLAGRKTTPLIRALLEQAWCDALALAILRNGEDSEAFHRRLAAADELLRDPAERDNEHLCAELEAGLAQVGLQGPEATQLARRVLDMQPVQSPRADAPSQTELAVRLKTRQRLGDDDEAPGSEPETTPLLPLNAEEQHALARLRSLPFGTWFEFTVNQQGLRVQRKLAWYTLATNRCLLVSARGAAAPERRLEQIARLLVLGQARLSAQQEESAIDRAWNSLVSNLHQFGKPARKAKMS
ncbi:MAG TPA: DUF1631 family protein [Rhodanobacteraceae bacterium]|nr:DUF1631 family protein [Rhodanobacteraceae bacterium]